MNRVYLPYPSRPPKPKLSRRMLNALHHLLWWPFFLCILLILLSSLLCFLPGVMVRGLLCCALEATAPQSLKDALEPDLTYGTLESDIPGQ